MGVDKSACSYLYTSYRVMIPFGYRGSYQVTFALLLEREPILGLMYSSPEGTRN